MANDKIYGDYLMHYRTPGSRNGYTKYPDKYKPIGEKAQEQVESNRKSSGGFFDSAKKFINNTVDYIKNDVAPAVEKKVAKTVGPGMIRNEITKNANPAIDRIMKPNTRTYASNEDNFKDFIRNDIRDRINVKSNVAKLRAASRMKKSINTAINDPRINKEFKNILDKDHNHVERGLAESLTNPRKAKMYAQVGLDAAVPTYNKRKATTEDNFKTFMKNDLRDRLNDHLKIAKDRAATGYENFAERFLNDERVQNDIAEFRNNPYAAKDIVKRKNVRDALIDASIPTYNKRKATTEDNFKTFMKNDIKDRTNDLKKKGKKKLKSLVNKLFHGDDIMENYKGVYSGRTLKHYRRKGDLNGKTRFPGKYKPIGKVAGKSVNSEDYLAEQRRKFSENSNISDWYNNGQSFGANLYNTQSSANTRKNIQGIRTGAMNVYGNAANALRKKQRIDDANQAIRTGAMNVYGNAANAKRNAIKNNQKISEQRRIAGERLPQYDKMTLEAKREILAKKKLRERVPNKRFDSIESAQRNSRSTIGNALHDARTDRDFGSFMKKDIKDRVAKGKKKVKKLLKKWF